MKTENDIQHLFEQARQSVPVTSVDEIRRLISSPVPTVTPKYSTVTKTIIIGSAASLAICGAVYYKMNKPETLPLKQVEVVQTDSNILIPMPEPENLSFSLITKNKKEVIDSSHELIPHEEVTNTNRVEEPVSQSAPAFSTPSIQPLANNDMLHLSNEELAKLGIRTDGNVLRYLNRIDTTTLKYTHNGKQIIQAYAADLEITKFGGIKSTNVHQLDSDLLNNSNQAVPLIISYSKNNETTQNFIVTDPRFTNELQSKYIYELKSHLIPVAVHTDAKPNPFSHSHDLIFWYRNNESFRIALPPELRQTVLHSYPPFNELYYLQYTEELSKEKARNSSNYSISTSLQNTLRKQWISISKTELKKLNIKFNGKKLVYNQFLKTTNGEDIRKDLLITPCTFNINNAGNTSLSPDKKACYPWYATDTSMAVILNFTDVADERKETERYYEIKRDNRKNFISRLDSMVPVYFAFDEKEVLKCHDDHPRRNQLLWFPKNNAFLNKLPEKARSKVIGTMAENVALINQRKINTASLHLIELSSEELLNLGVKATANGVSVPTQYEKMKSYYTTYSKSGTQLGNFNLIGKGSEVKLDGVRFKFITPKLEIRKSDSLRYITDAKFQSMNTESNIFVEPRLITDDLGNYWRSYKVDMNLSQTEIDYLSKNQLSPSTFYKSKVADSLSEQNLISRIGTMIPILVRTGDKYTLEDQAYHRWRPDVILWYEPTDSFFDALPKHISDEIKAEIYAINNKLPAPTCKYFEACQSVKGKINEYSVYPNPLTDELNVAIEMGEDRKLNIILTDISGRTILNLANGINQQKGKKEYQYHLSDLREGLYLLIIETDKGERVTQRIVKK